MKIKTWLNGKSTQSYSLYVLYTKYKNMFNDYQILMSLSASKLIYHKKYLHGNLLSMYKHRIGRS
jgi:hypothetical protein